MMSVKTRNQRFAKSDRQKTRRKWMRRRRSPLRILSNIPRKSDLHGLKFLHISKCGGTAVEAWGKANGFFWGRHWIALHDAWGQGLLPPMQGRMKSEPWHMPPAFFAHSPYAGHDVFVVVRNPYTRLISEFRCPWKGLSAPPGQSAEKRARRNDATSHDLNMWLQKKLQGGAASAPFSNGHFIPQSFYLRGLRCKAARKPTSRKSVGGGHGSSTSIGTVLRYERLNADFKRLVRRYGWKDRADLPTVNRSEMRRFTTQDLEESTRRLIEDVYADDFRLFRYRKLSPRV
eukprot:TRINITY_DN30275_c0_g1_i1.p1 TRINITY_DN30275_c0_g1~~TRINITY_DN30275_c0_g1_i1.p1  ORF type:complete len:288 (-),score=18.98 TRINITY_DN30275_c0_g1_i1:257-1120(-)